MHIFTKPDLLDDTDWSDPAQGEPPAERQFDLSESTLLSLTFRTAAGIEIIGSADVEVLAKFPAPGGGRASWGPLYTKALTDSRVPFPVRIGGNVRAALLLTNINAPGAERVEISALPWRVAGESLVEALAKYGLSLNENGNLAITGNLDVGGEVAAGGKLSTGQADATLTALGATTTGKGLFKAATPTNARASISAGIIGLAHHFDDVRAATAMSRYYAFGFLSGWLTDITVVLHGALADGDLVLVVEVDGVDKSASFGSVTVPLAGSAAGRVTWLVAVLGMNLTSNSKVKVTIAGGNTAHVAADIICKGTY